MRNITVFFALFFALWGSAQSRFFTSTDTIKIAYTDQGKGFPVLLVHGFINSGSSWTKTVLKKELLLNGYRVIVPDLRGNGLSDKPHKKDAYEGDREVQDLKALADHLQLKEYWAVGYSRGSIVLAKLLTRDARITKAVLGGMGIDFSDPNWERRRMFANAFNGKTTAETQGAVDYAKSIGADLRSLYLQQEYQPVTSKEELRTIKAQTLVIAGNMDTDNGDPAALQQAIPKSELQIVIGDHNGTYKTTAFSEKIISFLD